MFASLKSRSSVADRWVRRESVEHQELDAVEYFSKAIVKTPERYLRTNLESLGILRITACKIASFKSRMYRLTTQQAVESRAGLRPGTGQS